MRERERRERAHLKISNTLDKKHTQALHFGMVCNLITMRQTKQRKGGTTDCSFKDNILCTSDCLLSNQCIQLDK